MQIISIKNKSIDFSCISIEDIPCYSNEFVEFIKQLPDLDFDQKSKIIALTKPKSMKVTLDNFIKIYDNLCDEDKEEINDQIENNNYDLCFVDSFADLLNCVDNFDNLSSKYNNPNRITSEDLFSFFVFRLDTKYLKEPFQVKLGKSKTIINIVDVDSIDLPTKSQWEAIKEHLA